MNSGQLIAFAGLPSSGKSSTASALGLLMKAKTYLEPEESLWPDLIKTRDRTGYFTALTWFRSARVPQLYAADELRKTNANAIVDSYYDKILAGYLGDDSFKWLIAETDAHFPAARAMAAADWATLPAADILVFLVLTEVVWLEFMSARGRSFDRSAELNRHFEAQEKMLQTCRLAAHEHGTRLVLVEQVSGSPESTAARVLDAIAGS